MFFTLAVSAATPEGCAALTDRALAVDPSAMPVPGPAEVAWRSPDGRAALLRWGGGVETAKGGAAATGSGSAAETASASHAGTIWADGDRVYARTSVTRVDPVYLAEVRGAVIVADRATWAGWTSSRLDGHDPLHLCALLNPGFPLGSVTPFTDVTAMAGSTTLQLRGGSVTRVDGAATRAAGATRPHPGDARLASGPGGARDVAEALVAAVAPLRDAGAPVELSLTGGKDSRLIAAALVKAGVPVVARTHGFDDHPDVVVAAEIARRLGIEHVVRTPAAPGQRVDVLGRIRATVLVADGMLSAFENVGRPDPAASAALTAGGHGGELLRGGYAETVAGRGPARGPRGVP
ncbi:MAG: asparagine synthase-related protein, partial [Trebonia sp.]